MKTLLQFATAACLSLTLASLSFADDPILKTDHIMMVNGKMLVQKAGKVMMMDGQMSLENGTTVKPDGTVSMKDGQMMLLKNGEMIDMTGAKMARTLTTTEIEMVVKPLIEATTVTRTTTGQPPLPTAPVPPGVVLPVPEVKVVPAPSGNTNANSVTNGKTQGGPNK